MNENIVFPDPSFDRDADQNAPRALGLADYLDAASRGRWIIVASIVAFVLGALLISAMTRPVYRARSVVHIDSSDSSPFAEKRQPAATPDVMATHIQLLKGRDVAERVVRKLHLENDPEIYASKWRFGGNEVPAASADRASRTAEKLQQRLEIVPVRGANVLEIRYSAATAEKAAAVANAVAAEYVNWSVAARVENNKRLTGFLDAQIAQLEGSIAQKSATLQRYGGAKGIVGVSEHNVTMQSLEQLNRDHSSAVSDRVAAEARLRAVTGDRSGNVDPAAAARVAALRAELSQLEREYAQKLEVYKPAWPAMQQLAAQITATRSQIQVETSRSASAARQLAETELVAARQREQQLSAVLASKKNETVAANVDAVEYTRQESEIATTRATLEVLSRQRAQLSVLSSSRGEIGAALRTVEHALVPSAVHTPSYKRNVGVGGFFGLGVGFGVALLLHMKRNRVGRRRDLEALMPTRVTVVPMFRHEAPAAPLLILGAPATGAAESFRELASTLLLGRHDGTRAIAFTSANEGEGKTTMASNVAVALAQFGARVLLIDADVHRPRVHQIFGSRNRIGLGSILSGQARPSDAITPTSIPGLSVITAVDVSADQASLLASKWLPRLLAVVTEEYDFVLVDTPPLSLVAEAILPVSACDGAVLCVRAWSTGREQVEATRDRLMAANIPLLRVALNRAAEERPASDYRYRRNALLIESAA